MAVLPTPNGTPTLPDQATGSAYDESYFQALFTRQWGSAAGNAYAVYNKNHPQNSAYVNAQQFLDLVVAEGLSKAVKTAISGAGTALGAIPGAAAQGAQNAANALNPASGLAAIGQFFSNLGSAAWWLRIGEVALGLILVAVGVAKLVPAFTPAQLVARKLGA